ncbi:MAG: GDSL-type esterase/lipase family protein [Gammaproteobacteria bacterium]
MHQKTILCYGDSNTWGYVPSADYSLSKRRYSRNERWPGILQNLLGQDLILEEGLNSRATNIDYAVPPDRNGKTYLAPCLYSHAPIDLVIFALGGNDAKSYFNRSAEQIRDGMAELINVVQTSGYGKNLQDAPRILLLTPCIPSPFVENMSDEKGVCFLAGAVAKITQLVSLYEQLAKEKNCFYLNLSDIKPSNLDGVHYDQAAHNEYAKMVSEKIKAIFCMG